MSGRTDLQLVEAIAKELGLSTDRNLNDELICRFEGRWRVFDPLNNIADANILLDWFSAEGYIWGLEYDPGGKIGYKKGYTFHFSKVKEGGFVRAATKERLFSLAFLEAKGVEV